MQKPAAFLMVTVLLLGLFLMRESRGGVAAGIETSYGDWIATNTVRTVPAAHVTLVEINDSSVASGHPWPWPPLEYALFLQAALPLKPDVVAIEPLLDWEGVSFPGESRQKMEQYRKFLHDYILQAPKVVLGSQLGGPDDQETVSPLLPAPRLGNVTGDIRAIPAFTDITGQAEEDYRLSASVGFTNFPADPGEIVRKVPMVFNYRGEIVPSFILQTLIQWYKLTPDVVAVEPGVRIALGKDVTIPIDIAGRMNVDFGSSFARFGHDDLLLSAAEQYGVTLAAPGAGQHGDKSAPAISTDAIKGGVVILARTDGDSRMLLTPSRARESYGELCAAAIATVQNKAFSRHASALFDFAVIALMMALSCYFHRLRKRAFVFVSFMALLGYVFLSMSVYAIALVRLPFVLPVGLLLLMNFFSFFSPRDLPAPAAGASPPQPGLGRRRKFRVMNKKRIIQRAAIAAGVLIVACAVILLRPKYGEVALVNEAGESVVKCTVVIDGREFDVNDIPPGGIRRLKFKIQGDTHYTVSVEFHYERTLGTQAGSFINKVKSHHQLFIKHDLVVQESGDD